MLNPKILGKDNLCNAFRSPFGASIFQVIETN